MKRLTSDIPTSGYAIAIDDTPLPNQDIPSCLTSKKPVLCHAIPSPLLSKTFTFTQIDPTKWFCDAKVCPAIRSGIVVYRDTTHISVDYALHLVPVMSSQLTGLGLR